MNPVQKALWYIESHFNEEILLDQLAAISGVSRYHLSRAFGETVGRPISSYLRGRRLTEAARSLSRGADDILAVALDAGYGSHEAFTRAFRDQFGITPEAVRRLASLENICLVEPIRMGSPVENPIAPPRFEDRKPLLVAGLSKRFKYDSIAGIPQLWQQFNAFEGTIDGQVSPVAYGVCCNFDDTGSFDYVCAVEVRDFMDLPDGFVGIRIPAARYAVFKHTGHISTFPATVKAIWNEQLPSLGLCVLESPNFELYGPEFDSRTGEGGVEVWIPIKS